MLTNKLTGAGAGADKAYIEDVFSTYLYTGTGAAQTINNGIDLAGKGGMVWLKDRQYDGEHGLFDTARGATKALQSHLTAAQITENGFVSFNSNGFTLGNPSEININTPSRNTVAWTFRKAPKFFDVVTYTGNGVNGRTINHSLGVAPGMVIIKRTDASENWGVFHRGNGTGNAWTGFSINLTSAGTQGTAQSTVTDTTVNVTDIWGAGNSPAWFNSNGATYVAYLFAHDTDTDGLIQCGSYTGNGSTTGPTVTLGWEPQYLLVKNTTSTANWVEMDSMRGMAVGSGGDSILYPNLSNAESNGYDFVDPTATGFNITTTSNLYNTSGNTYIYMAIRRGPMKTPTDGTKVFKPISSNQAVGTENTTGFSFDTQICTIRTLDDGSFWMDRLRGVSTSNSNDGTRTLASFNTNAESVSEQSSRYWSNTGFQTPQRNTGYSTVYHSFKRAPGFFDVVCYTGTGVARTVNHNLGVAPELMIVKMRSPETTRDWNVYAAPLGNTKTLYLNTTNAAINYSFWNSTTPTSSVFSIVSAPEVNGNGSTYVAYLFASCPGVSKVGSYTGNGSSQTINCGFTAGARFVLIKRTNSTGDWYVWDTARGIVTGNDPHLSLNTTAAEVTTDDTIDPASSGFIVNQVAATNVNVSGGSYIYLAIA